MKTKLHLVQWTAGTWDFKAVNQLQDQIAAQVNSVYAEKDAHIDYLEKQNELLIKSLGEKHYQRIVYKQRKL